jgi:hypothetical protein
MSDYEDDPDYDDLEDYDPWDHMVNDPVDFRGMDTAVWIPTRKPRRDTITRL